jgi:hypothetical protein
LDGSRPVGIRRSLKGQRGWHMASQGKIGQKNSGLCVGVEVPLMGAGAGAFFGAATALGAMATARSRPAANVRSLMGISFSREKDMFCHSQSLSRHS